MTRLECDVCGKTVKPRDMKYVIVKQYTSTNNVSNVGVKEYDFCKECYGKIFGKLKEEDK